VTDDQTHPPGFRDAQESSAPPKVVVAGQGYVGLPVAMRAVEVDCPWWASIPTSTGSSGSSAASPTSRTCPTPPCEALPQRYTASSEARACRGFDYAVITVPTPLTERARPLLHRVGIHLARYLGPRDRHPGVDDLPGTTGRLILEEGSGLSAGRTSSDTARAHRPRQHAHTFVNTPKVVSGVDAASLRSVQDFYETLVDSVVPVSGTAEAELTKLLENTFRHVNVALVNELAMFAGDMNIDIYEAIEAASTKPFGFMRFVPGPGVGGHCLPIDPSYLSWVSSTRSVGLRSSSWRTTSTTTCPTTSSNGSPRRWTAVPHGRERQPDPVLGLSHKSNTGDVRESPAVMVAERLVEMGADVRAVEPYLGGDSRISLSTSPKKRSPRPTVVLLTDHDQLDRPRRGQASYVLDTLRLSGPNVEGSGLGVRRRPGSGRRKTTPGATSSDQAESGGGRPAGLGRARRPHP
jgi:UDP-N-acetyl-D-glucosamine dehydrogenase